MDRLPETWSARRALPPACRAVLLAACVATLAPAGAAAAEELVADVYPTYGTRREVAVAGRILKAKVLPPEAAGDPWWTNLRRTIVRLLAKAKEEVPVRVAVLGLEAEGESDEEGFFAFTLKGTAPFPPGVHRVEAYVGRGRGEPAGEGIVVIPPDSARLGVITDIDDTLVVTEMADKRRAFWHAFLENPRQREPVPGMAPLLRDLGGGPDGRGMNPIFYVSGGPVRFYRPVASFLRLNGFPAGPLELRKVGIGREKDPWDVGAFKAERIRAILSTYPGMRFILLGDDGESDPEVYDAVARDFPERVAAVYVRVAAADATRKVYPGQVLVADGAEIVRHLRRTQPGLLPHRP